MTLNCVSREQLAALSQLAPTQEPKTGQTNGAGPRFDLGRWIVESPLEVEGPEPWQAGGHRWVFPVCPWNPDHTNGSAYIVQHANGAIAAGCHHNGCHGKDWSALRDLVEPGWRERRRGPESSHHDAHASSNGDGERDDPWRFIKDAPTFLAEPQPEFEGLAKDLLTPGAITMVAAPRGLGKTQVAHSLGVALATGGVFRGERVKPTRVLLLDRDNPEYIIRQRLHAWGAEVAKNLHILTRQHAPSLRQRDAWANFPLDAYDVIIMDAVGSFTEGITEKEGKQTTEVLATIVDLARQGLGILLLQNATKDGLNFKGREEWADRVDIIYELRDATDFIPSLKKPWWEELPEAHEGAWAARAARRKGRCDFRLAFIPSKYRLGPEPEPFCLELQLPGGGPWTLEDVTHKLLEAGEEARAEADAAHKARLRAAGDALLTLVIERDKARSPILKTEAESFLYKEHEITQRDARQLIKEQTGTLWIIESRPQGRGKAHAQALLPVDNIPNTLPIDDRQNDRREAASDKADRVALSVEQCQSQRQTNPPCSPWRTSSPENEFVCRDSGGIEDRHSPENPEEWEEGVL